MKGMRKLSITATAMVAAAVMALAGCGSSNSSSSSSSSASTSGTKTSKFVLGGLWPETGSLAYPAPPELAAEKLAVKDINDAGGVLGNKITTVDADTSDADHADQNTSAAQSVLSKNPSFIIGPASSSVVKNTYKSITSQNIPMLSMGATSASFSGLSDYFFRTVAPDTVQGAVMGNLIAPRRRAEARHRGLQRRIRYRPARHHRQNRIRGRRRHHLWRKGHVRPDRNELLIHRHRHQGIQPRRDARHRLRSDQTAAEGARFRRSQHQEAVLRGRQHLRLFQRTRRGPAGRLEGHHPGINPSDDFVKRLESTGVDLKNTTTYGAETYDGIILAALAAQKGGSADGKTIQANMAAVSGSTKGEKCDSYKACVALLKDGKEIQYKGQTSIGAFNDAHDPSSASIGVYKYDADNKPVFDHSREGSVPKA